MQTSEQKYQIDISIKGTGVQLVKDLVLQHYPQARIRNVEETDDELKKREDIKLYKDLKSKITPGDRLAGYRGRAGLSITELAKLTGISHTNISAMEANRRVIGLRVAQKLVKFLNCNYTDLLEV
jgi:hypothetical protein